MLVDETNDGGETREPATESLEREKPMKSFLSEAWRDEVDSVTTKAAVATAGLSKMSWS